MAGQLFRIAYGYVACALASAIAFCLISGAGFGNLFIGFGLATMVALVAFVQGLLPFVVCAAIAELARIKSVFYYLAFSAVPALWLFLPFLHPESRARLSHVSGVGLFAVAVFGGALAGGLVYWALAGRFAGDGRRQKPIA